MTIMTKKLGVSLATACLMTMLSTGSVFADTTVTIGGNGASSNNDVKIVNSCKSTVTQNNATTAVTNVASTADTGHVSANSNTGGTVDVQTGDAVSTVGVVVTGGDNTAMPAACCDCNTGDVVVDVSGNGAMSDNDVKLKNKTKLKTTQNNSTTAVTSVDSKAKTGKIKTNKNTGAGVSVVTGSSLSTVGVTVAGGMNTLTP